eukprot:3311347-Rhodomonas_salina.1
MGFRTAACRAAPMFLFLISHLAQTAGFPGQQYHPDDQLVWISAARPTFRAFQAREWHFEVGGVLQTAKYRVVLEISFEGQPLYSTVRYLQSEQDRVSISFELPGMEPWKRSLNLRVYDEAPNLDIETALLAVRMLDVQIASLPDPKPSDVIHGAISCRAETLVWDSAENTNSETLRELHGAANSGEQISLVSVASIDRSLVALQVAASWEGPLAYALYARSVEEELALRKFVLKDLGPSCEARGQGLKVLLVSMCHEHGEEESVLAFPINFLRSAAVQAAATDLVLYSDMDFLPSAGASQVLKSAVNARVRNGTAVLVVPCFMTTEQSPLLQPPRISCTPQGVLEVATTPLTKVQIRSMFEAGIAEVPSTPCCFHMHCPVDYVRWLENTTDEAYEIQYTM